MFPSQPQSFYSSLIQSALQNTISFEGHLSKHVKELGLFRIEEHIIDVTIGCECKQLNAA